MQIAYLILAHNQPTHLNRLIRALQAPAVNFYVHIDQKSDLKAFQPEQAPPNVFFLPHRLRVTHGGFSTVQAMLLLLQAAAQEPKNNYFIFLSGWDYPLRSNQEIQTFLTAAYPQNFINFYPLVGDAAHVQNIQKYHFFDWLGRFPHFLQPFLNLGQTILRLLPYRRKFLPKLTPFRGSTSFCLNRATITDLLTFLPSAAGQRYLNYFKRVACADEIFFPTFVLNSSHAPTCRYYARDLLQTHTRLRNENKAYLHYIDWDPTRENPAHLNLTDWEKIQQSDKLFARKFHETKSAPLLAALDQARQTASLSELPF
jgi:hypothetical protein